ncbi:universal stress protein [Roseibium sp.]|uniref:universal stress protein n=1 Tax=Roseibium sp. TaxID=1936156 RepID=UPI003264E82C
MSVKYVVGYDGSQASEGAIRFAIALAKSCDAVLVVAHVLEWSPYSFLTPTEIEERHKRRNEELKRAEQALIGPLIAKIKSEHAAVESVIRYGNIVDTLMSISTDCGADQIFIGRTGHSSLSTRVFGSVAGSLAQHADVPVTIVP